MNQRLADNVVSEMVMHGIGTIGVILQSQYIRAAARLELRSAGLVPILVPTSADVAVSNRT